MDSEIVGRGWAFPPQVNDQGRITLVDGYDEISQAIHIILNTARGERVMRPDFGSRLYELVFAPITVETMALARQYVDEALAIWEPRITVLEIGVRDPFALGAYDHSAPGCLSIEIQYMVKTTGDKRSLVYPFYLIPGE